MILACLRTLVATLAVWTMLAAWTQGEEGDFRVDTTVHADGEVVAENRTLFVRNRVYDISLAAGEITFLDYERRKFVLVDPRRRLKTSIDTRQIYDATQTILERIRQQHGADFATLFDVQEKEGLLVVADKAFTYEAEGESPSQASAAAASAPQRFRTFADWYAQVNAIRGAGPPFTRMELNKQLASRSLMPKTIRRRAGRGVSSTQVEARHVTIWALSRDDRERIERIGEHLAKFTEASPAEYFAAPPRVARKSSSR